MVLAVGRSIPQIPFVTDEGYNEEILQGQYGVLCFFPLRGEVTKRQMRFLRDAQGSFMDLGAVVIGVSMADDKTLELFRYQQRVNFSLLSDPSTKFIAAYGALGQRKKGSGTVPVVRRHCVITDPSGRVLSIFQDVDPRSWLFLANIRDAICDDIAKKQGATDESLFGVWRQKMVNRLDVDSVSYLVFSDKGYLHNVRSRGQLAILPQSSSWWTVPQPGRLYEQHKSYDAEGKPYTLLRDRRSYRVDGDELVIGTVKNGWWPENVDGLSVRRERFVRETDPTVVARYSAFVPEPPVTAAPPAGYCRREKGLGILKWPTPTSRAQGEVKKGRFQIQINLEVAAHDEAYASFAEVARRRLKSLSQTKRFAADELLADQNQWQLDAGLKLLSSVAFTRKLRPLYMTVREDLTTTWEFGGPLFGGHHVTVEISAAGQPTKAWF